MESAGDGSSNAPGEGEVNQSQEHANPPGMTSAERCKAAMAKFLENQSV